MYAMKDSSYYVYESSCEVTCILSIRFGIHYLGLFCSLCLAACGYMPKLMTKPHLVLHELNAQTYWTRLGLSSGGVRLPLNFTIYIYIYIYGEIIINSANMY